MIHFQDDHVTLHHGDCLDVLSTLPDASVDAVVTDPPYGIRFMGHSWDGADIESATATRRAQAAMPDDGRSGANGGYRSASTEAGRYDLSANAAFGHWCEAWARECLRILKPGGHMLAFGGSRTWHRLASAVEDAGFEIRDSIAWLYGSGFPKSLDVSKAIDKAAGAERAVLATIPDRWAGKGCGSRELQHTQTAADSVNVTTSATVEAQQWEGWGTALKPAFEPIVVGRKPLAGTVAANVLQHGTGALNIDGCRIETTENLSGGMNRPGATASGPFIQPSGRWPANVLLDESQAAALDEQSGHLESGTKRAGTERQPRQGGTIYGADARNFTPADTYGDSGGASRFFPTFRYEAKAPTSERPRVGDVAHPTVKPVALMRWLVRLVTPPGGVVLEPFAGSGTTAEACIAEGMRCIAIEREADYLPLIRQRLDKPIQAALNFGA